MTAYVDPVTEGRAYQELLLRLLGDQDPAEVMQRTPAQLRRLAAEAGESLRVRPEQKEWSLFECIGHVIDAELVISGRLRFILAHDEPPLPGYDQDLWVDRLHQSRDESIDELMAWFEPLRAANLRLWHETPPEGSRARRHPQRAWAGELRADLPTVRRTRHLPHRPGDEDAGIGARPPLTRQVWTSSQQLAAIGRVCPRLWAGCPLFRAGCARFLSVLATELAHDVQLDPAKIGFLVAMKSNLVATR